MITVQYAKAFPDMRINAVEPGHASTDINAHAGMQTVEEGAENIGRMAQVDPDGPDGPTGPPAPTGTAKVPCPGETRREATRVTPVGPSAFAELNSVPYS